MIKILFYIFLFCPQFKGALTLYRVILDPLVSKLMVFETNAGNYAKVQYQDVKASYDQGVKGRKVFV